MDKESARIVLDNLRTYIQMYREWGLEGISVNLNIEKPASKASERGRLHPAVPVEGATRAPMIISKSAALAALRTEIGDCTRCKLHTGRTHLVFGTGDPEAGLMFVGEAPGEDEDRQGLPFVGKAGQLLTRIIEAMGLKRESVYIANIIKCRPPRNRNPEPDEIASCSPFIQRQIEILRPKVVCALGSFAARTLLGTGQKISQLRGRFHDLPILSSDGSTAGIKVMPTFHPAYLLRNPDDKKRVWEDMKMIMRELNLPARTAGSGAPP
ncbi:MAG: uracil-DNA glycosylase [Nitrospirae bacterium]|nr:uracil-DNA glycosylase [Nitrospirota bacterium]